MILTCLFIFLQMIHIINYFVTSTEVKDFVYLLTRILYLITTICILWLINYDRLKNIFSSGLLFIYWLLVFLATIPDLIDYSVKIYQQIQSVSWWIKFITACLQFCVVLCLFIANCFAEKYNAPEATLHERPLVPEFYVSFPSRILYSWVTPLILRGYRKPLTEKDCWELPMSERTVSVVDQVRNYMKGWKSNTQYEKISMKKIQILDSNSLEDEHRNLLNNIVSNYVFIVHDLTQKKVYLKPTVDVNESSSKNRKTSMFWYALFCAYKEKIFIGALIKLVHDILQFSGPMILKLLLNYFTDLNKPKWLGVFYASLLSIVVFCQIILLRAYFHCQFLVGLQFRSAITGLIYRKSLKLSNASKQETTTGEIVNLMAIDASRFAEVTQHIHVLWSGPLQLLIALILLYREMKFSIIPGVTLLFIVILTNLYLHRIQKKLTFKQMKIKDQRIKMTSEILNGIRVLKLYAWEVAFIRSITRIRDKELEYIRKKAILTTISNILWTFTPILVGILTFATYVLSSDTNILIADKAFVSIALFNLLRSPLVVFPNVMTNVVEARVSNKRIENFLNSEEIDEDAVDRISIDSNKYAVKMENSSFRWSNLVDDPIILKNINMQIEHGSLIAVVGMVGSGKSSILAALLGEINKVHGHVSISGTIAYVPQTAWIMNTTLKENILFGRDFDRHLYNRVIEACALKQDLDMLPANDETEIGEKGINLSGGQRQRVSLARALYSNADIFLLDDPLSAVDAHVGTHIFKNVIGPKGLLNGKTRLLVTHGISHLSKCDDIIVVSQGEIIDHGSYNDLMIRSNILQDFVHSVPTSHDEDYQRRTSDLESSKSIPTTPSELIANPFESIENDTQQDELQPVLNEIAEEKRKTIEKEFVQTGSVKLNIFSIYIRSCKLFMVGLIMIFFGLTICASLRTNIWLSKWTDTVKSKTLTNNTSSRSNQIYYMNIYSILGLIQGNKKKDIFNDLVTFVKVHLGFLGFTMQLMQKFASYIAGRKLHWMILIGILHAPSSFFDTTPIGRIINRFSKDIDVVDSTLPNAFSQSLTILITVIVTLIILIYGSLETIQGLTSIRAYQAQQRFIDLSDKFMDRNQSYHLASSVSNRWLGLRLEMIANLLTLFTAITAVFMRDSLTAGTVGLMITFALQITHSLNMLVRVSSDVETNIVSVERIDEYAKLKPEASWDIQSKKPPPYWPIKGNINITNLSTRYRENLQLILKDLSIDIQSGEKIGIIGRTGSGKSSLCLSLFRIIEPTNGTIFIDNVDIRLIGLPDLRSKITIIPQDAIIFAGTIRFNIDPFSNYSDTEVWNVLELVHLKERIYMMENGLSYLLAEEGQNMSAGEKQLLCLARALLRKSKIFIFDEATAAIDMETDRLIQQTIRSRFHDATVLTIAHRLHTILDSTKILVLSNGSLQEYDEPKRLAADPNSAFAKFLSDANIHLSDIMSINSS
ncbi:unnamed protein product [Rotaria magnacalcarata]|uniref:Uncharacterized protein n=5 Tax=Rotaria magnacalcarata TaxID=392030 RepID=A0A816Y255_9BILA|nr:unnamed protein product [Rotaria magnacalcarata]